MASLVAEDGLWVLGLGCSARASPPHSIWDRPRPGTALVSPALAGRFVTAGPSGNSCLFRCENSYGRRRCWAGQRTRLTGLPGRGHKDGRLRSILHPPRGHCLTCRFLSWQERLHPHSPAWWHGHQRGLTWFNLERCSPTPHRREGCEVCESKRAQQAPGRRRGPDLYVSYRPAEPGRHTNTSMLCVLITHNH